MNDQKRIVIVGGGPAGLMAAEVAARAGCEVQVFDAMPSVGRKFLMAGKGGLNIRLSKMLTGYDIDVYREVEEEDVALTEFADEIDGWIIDALKNVGCDTAKSVLELPVEEIAARADLELEQAQKVVEILKAEFEE